MRSTRRLHLMLTAGVAALALTALPVGFDSSTTIVGAAQAWADNGNGNGHANGHQNVAGDSQGATASSLGALNAAHASDTALANAAPNSRVGRIAAYRDAELAAQDAAAADQAVVDAQADLDAALALNADGIPENDVPADTIDALTQAVTDAQTLADATDAEALQADADAALVDAANKDITDEDGNVLSDIRDAVNNLLGI